MLGYIQRGGTPTSFDRNLATMMGGYASELIASGRFGRMVALRGNRMHSISLDEVAGKVKLVTKGNDLVQQALRLGVCFG